MGRLRSGPARARSETRSRRASVALCALMLAASVWALARWTHGFEVWTHEGRRALAIEAGSLRAADVALVGSDGRPLQLWSGNEGAPARAYLVDWIYLDCPGVCRALGGAFQQAQQQLAARPDAAGVRLLSVSFDLAHDRPRRLARRAAQLHADPARWRFAVPATADAAQELLRSLGVVVIPDGAGGFVHNGEIHLLDADGRLRGLYSGAEWPQALAAAQRLAAGPDAR